MEQYPRNRFTFSLVAGWKKANTALWFSVSCFIWRCLDILQQDLIRLYSPVYKFCSEGGRKIQFSTEKLFVLFSLPFSYIIWDTTETKYPEKVRWSKTPHNIYLAVISELFILSSLFEARWECTVCPLAWQSESNTPSLVFTALLWRSAALPFNFTSSVRLPLRSGEIQLDLQQLFRGTNDFFWVCRQRAEFFKLNRCLSQICLNIVVLTHFHAPAGSEDCCVFALFLQSVSASADISCREMNIGCNRTGALLGWASYGSQSSLTHCSSYLSLLTLMKQL